MTAPDAMVHRARQKVPRIRPIAGCYPPKRTRRSKFEPRCALKPGCGPRWEGLLPRLLEGIDHVAGLVFRRCDNGQGLRIPELVDTIAFDPAELRLEDPRLRPFAVLAKRNIADDGFECGLAQVISEFGVVDAFGCRDRLSENVEIRVAERSHIVAERIHARFDGTILILLHEFRCALENQGFCRQPEV